MKNKLLILDRDGTLIFDKVYLNDPANIEYLPGVFTALKQFQKKGFQFAVATNQSGIPRGKVQLENLLSIHQRMRGDFERQGLTIEKFYFSPHLPDSDHPSRKPNPGMLLQALKDLVGDPGSSWMIGDKMIDVEAGHRAGCRSALIGKIENSGEAESKWLAPEANAENWSNLMLKLDRLL